MGFVPAVHFIDKERRALAVQLAPLTGHVNGLANFLDSGQHGVDGDEVAAGAIGDDKGQSCLARAGWAVEDE